MKQLLKAIAIFILAACTVGTLQAQKKSKKKKAKTHTTTNSKKKKTASSKAAPKKKTAVAKQASTAAAESSTQVARGSLADTSSPKVVVITSVFKPQLKTAAKFNFTAATPVIDSSRIPVTYAVPAQNLFFTYQPVPIKPLALPHDSGYTWENHSYIKLGAGNYSSYFGEAALAFGDGKHSITNLRGNFQTTTGHLPAQQAAKWGVDVLSIFNTTNHEWTTRPYYQSTTQYLYGYEPATLAYSKDQLLQRHHTVGIELGMQNKLPNDFDITYHPQVSGYRFFDNRENHENGVKIQAPIRKAFGKLYSFDLGLTADISAATITTGTASVSLKNNLYFINPAIRFITPNMKLNLGIQPSWDNTAFSALPDLTVEAKLADISLVLEAGWKGYFQKNSFRSLAAFNPWIGPLGSLLNTKIMEQYAGIKGAGGDHFTYQVRASLLKLNNQPLFLNNATDGKTFNVLYEPEMHAVRLHGELSYTEQEKFSFTAGATFSQYNSFTVNPKAWGLLPMELTGSLKWKLMKDLLVKADAFVWDGAYYRDNTLMPRKNAAAADLNLGAEFTVMPRLNLWLQMNNLLNTTYQRWNQYQVLGFNVLGGIVYSFR